MKFIQFASLIIVLFCLSNILSAHIKRKNRKFTQERTRDEQPLTPEQQAERERESLVLANIFKRLNYDKYLKLLDALASDDQAYKEIKAMMRKELTGVKVYLQRIPVSILTPTQNEIGLSDSLQYPFEHPPTTNYSPYEPPENKIPVHLREERQLFSKEKVPQLSDLKNVETRDFFSNKTIYIKDPIVTYNHKYVIDGHHRWSELYMINPYAHIACLNIEPIKKEEPLQMLKLIQRFILMKKSQKRSEKAGFINVFTANEYVLKQYIRANMTQGFVDYYMKRTGVTKFEDVVNSIYKNIRKFQIEKKPIENAPMRLLMPQMDARLNKLKINSGNYSPLYKEGDSVNLLSQSDDSAAPSASTSSQQ